MSRVVGLMVVLVAAASPAGARGGPAPRPEPFAPGGQFAPDGPAATPAQARAENGLELALGGGLAMNVGDGTAAGLVASGRLARTWPGGLELAVGVDGALIPSLRLDGGDRYAESGSAQRARLLGAVGVGSRGLGAASYLRLAAGVELLHVRKTTRDWSDGDTTVTHGSDTGVGPALGLVLGAGSRRRGGYYGVELGLGAGLAVEVTGAVDLMFVYRSR